MTSTVPSSFSSSTSSSSAATPSKRRETSASVDDAANPSVDKLKAAHHSTVCCVHCVPHDDPRRYRTLVRLAWLVALLLLVAFFSAAITDFVSFYVRELGFLRVNGLSWPGWASVLARYAGNLKNYF